MFLGRFENGRLELRQSKSGLIFTACGLSLGGGEEAGGGGRVEGGGCW